MKRLALVVCALGIAVPALAQDASGKWQLTVTRQQGTNTTSMVLKKDGDKLTGTIVGPQGSELAITGTQTGADVAFAFTAPTQNGTITVSMRGRQDGESMKGTMDLGDRGQGEWAAARASTPAATPSGTSAINITGTWALQVTTSAGSGSPTVALKQEGDKLTGTYKGQFGEGPVSGQIKDSAFSFQVTMTIEGNSITLTYSGKVEENAMSGRVTFGDIAEGTFTGKKQESGGE